MRMLKLFSLTVILLMGHVLISTAQNPTHGKLLDLVPPSPNAAALGKFGDIPVSYATGIPGVSIPIYNYADKGTGLNLDISLSYHAGGVRVEEHASNVGVGWALNAGGVITREVRGLPDERGYWAQGSFPTYIPEVIQTQVGVDANLQFAQYYLGLADTEPDVFTFNLSGKTGKFVIGKNGQVYLFPKQKVKIEKTVAPGLLLSFTVTDDNGVKYFFDQQESTQMKAGDGTLYNSGSAWYVSRMVAPFNEDSVVFRYNDIDAWYKVNAGQVIYKNKPGSYTGSLEGPPTTGQDLRSYHGKRIASIVLPTGVKIDMQYASSNRCDVSGGDAVLKNIVISDSSGITPTARGFRLVQNYSFADTADFVAGSCAAVDSNSARLILHKVIEYAGNVEKPAYLVEYNTQVALPGYFSYSQDHWGFFNGAGNNHSLLPYEGGTYMRTPPASSGADNADRSVNPDYVTAGIIKKMTYPTGGYTSFIFEPNTVPAGTSTEGGISYINVQKKVSLNAAVDPRSTTFAFTSPQGTSDLNTSFTFSVGSIGGANCSIVASIRNLAGDTVFASAILSPTAGWQKTVSKQLPSGQYMFRYDFDNNTTCSADLYVVAVEWISREAYVPPPGNNFEYAGGLRIRKIQDCDGIGQPVKTREYTYLQEGDTVSSGVMVFKPLYHYDYAEECLLASDLCAGKRGDYNVICNSSLYTLANTLGSPVIYSRVVEKYTGDGTGNGGKIIRTFSTNTYSESILQYTFPYITPMLSTWSAGQLIGQKIYDNTGRLLQATKNIYSNYINPMEDSVKANFIGLKFSKFYRTYSQMGDALGTSDFYRTNSYNLFTGLTQLQSSVDTVFDYFGNMRAKETKYQYDSVYYSTKVITTKDSKGATINQRMYYPYDYTIAGPLQDMVAANMVTPVVSNEIWQNNGAAVTMIGGEATEYAKFGNLIKPYRLYYLNATTDVPQASIGGFNPQKLIRDTVLFKPEVEFNYNTEGGLIEQKKRFDIKEVYLYGYYNRKYPVAKITKTDYSTAQSFITQSILDAPSTDQALRDELNKLRNIPGAMVLTFTHAPLYGMTSQTDINNRTTYYEYDGFGRLKLVKDKDGNILKTYQYNYKQ